MVYLIKNHWKQHDECAETNNLELEFFGGKIYEGNTI